MKEQYEDDGRRWRSKAKVKEQDEYDGQIRR